MADHAAMLEALDRHPGPVVLSGYDSPLYLERLAAWTRVSQRTRNSSNVARDERLWLNPTAAAQTVLFPEEVATP